MDNYENSAIVEKLSNCRLFTGMSKLQMKEFMDKHPNAVHRYPKGSFIFHQEEKPNQLYILLEGRISIAQETMTGRKISITEITCPGEMFGEVYLFVEREKYDMHAEAMEETRVLEFSKSLLLHGANAESEKTEEWESKIQQNLLRIFAEKAYQLNQKMRVLGSGSIREKIVQFLLARQDSDGKIPGNFSREAMADYMNVTRPSLSRELGKMQEEGILKLQGKQIMITDQEKFESYI